ncbi:MAG: response regulator [Phycisphaerae bacterium]
MAVMAMRGESRSGTRAKSVLVIEDEADLAELICYHLEREGYAFRSASLGDAAIAEIRRRPPDLILLDRMLPGTSGDEVCKAVRRDPATAGIPIIMLTAKGEESEQLVGFALGADDYITKPFSMKVLMARVGAMLRRNEPAQADPGTLSAGPFVLNVARHQLTVDGSVVSLTATEFRLLRALMQARGRVLDRGQLIERALGSGVVVTDRTIDVHITALRKKIGSASPAGQAASWVATVRGAGYAFREPTA